MLLKSCASGALMGNDPLKLMLGGLMGSGLAQGQTSSNPRRYIVIHQGGGPPRWMYDLMLNPHRDNRFGDGADHGMGTRFKGTNQNRYTELAFDQFDYRGLSFPYLWSQNVAARGSGFRPASALLDNMFHFRGINMGNASHDGAIKNQQVPGGADETLTALVGDHTDKPFSTMNINLSGWNFTSAVGKGFQRGPFSGSGNLISMLLSPFQRVDSLDQLNAAVGSQISAMENAMLADAQNRGNEAAAIRTNIATARELISRNFGDLNQQWADLESKYLDLVNRTLGMEFAGINDKLIGIDPAQRTAAMEEYQFSGALNL